MEMSPYGVHKSGLELGQNAGFLLAGLVSHFTGKAGALPLFGHRPHLKPRTRHSTRSLLPRRVKRRSKASAWVQTASNLAPPSGSPLSAETPPLNLTQIWGT